MSLGGQAALSPHHSLRMENNTADSHAETSNVSRGYVHDIRCEEPISKDWPVFRQSNNEDSDVNLKGIARTLADVSGNLSAARLPARTCTYATKVKATSTSDNASGPSPAVSLKYCNKETHKVRRAKPSFR
ncbi:hypothetical protein EYF80_019360 [Liparis tanakae]|uniref:Uncharacterized protein n=1 Tax=Liparis tanakae TaxID=230148 RepID=A0A4Z2HZA7_9TELE|nr:hypothetical protein EYF80_019360 [Liparis tanakae]